MRRWTLLGFAAVAVGLIGWTAMELQTEGAAGTVTRPVGAEAPDRPVESANRRAETEQPRPRQPVEPESLADARRAKERVDDVLAELHDKHDALVAAGAMQAAETVQAQIDRLEVEQQDRMPQAE